MSSSLYIIFATLTAVLTVCSFRQIVQLVGWAVGEFNPMLGHWIVETYVYGQERYDTSIFLSILFLSLFFWWMLLPLAVIAILFNITNK